MIGWGYVTRSILSGFRSPLARGLSYPYPYPHPYPYCTGTTMS